MTDAHKKISKTKRTNDTNVQHEVEKVKLKIVERINNIKRDFVEIFDELGDNLQQDISEENVDDDVVWNTQFIRKVKIASSAKQLLEKQVGEAKAKASKTIDNTFSHITESLDHIRQDIQNTVNRIDESKIVKSNAGGRSPSPNNRRGKFNKLMATLTMLKNASAEALATVINHNATYESKRKVLNKLTKAKQEAEKYMEIAKQDLYKIIEAAEKEFGKTGGDTKQ